jgi:homopolymeric O-antigen transport system ATP-binding protein
MRPVIVSEGLSKRYTLGYREPYSTVRDSLKSALMAPQRWLRRNRGSKDVPSIWALKDVSFEIRQGELVGVIGRNGSGKSTLLKILSRITEPTAGRVVVTGRVGSLLEVGTGFHPELTGRENVLVNGVILGMKRAEIARKFDEIVAFSEVETFIDTPVKHYSSGMQMRLAFAVAAHLEPTILLVDEVLAVGDVAFQKKCIGKMGDVAREGRTVLFVSHDLTSVQVLCQRAIRLAHGQVQGIGPVAEQIATYLAESRAATPCELDHPVRLTDDLELLKFGFAPNPLPSGSPATFDIELRAARAMRFDEVAPLIEDKLGRRISVIDFRQASGLHEAGPNRNLRLRATLASVPLIEGEYRIGLFVRAGDSYRLMSDIITLDVSPASNAKMVPYRTDIRGVVALDYTVSSFAPYEGYEQLTVHSSAR